MNIRPMLNKFLRAFLNQSSTNDNVRDRFASPDTSSMIASLQPKDLSSEDYIRLAYLVLLQRPVDEVGMSYWKERIASKTFRYKDLLDATYSSPEFLMHYKVPFSEVLHKARQQWCGSLEKFDYILDIGGSSANTASGALIELGYRFRPRELTIFDLPEDQQYWGKPKFSQNQDYTFEWGTVSYVHGFAENLDRYVELNHKKFDLVYMGQTIEHIQKDALGSVLNWIKQHLNPEGRLIFDTPNRTITKIQMPNSYIDVDHKYEYTPEEMEVVLNDHGFAAIKKIGMLEMTETIRSQKFNPLEVYETRVVNDHPESSYVFAFECVAI